MTTRLRQISIYRGGEKCQTLIYLRSCIKHNAPERFGTLRGIYFPLHFSFGRNTADAGSPKSIAAVMPISRILP